MVDWQVTGMLAYPFNLPNDVSMREMHHLHSHSRTFTNQMPDNPGKKWAVFPTSHERFIMALQSPSTDISLSGRKHNNSKVFV